MKVACSNCQKEYNVPDEKIPAAGIKVSCKACGKPFMVRRPAPEDDLLEDLPPAPPPARPSPNPSATVPAVATPQPPAPRQMSAGEVMRAAGVAPARATLPAPVVPAPVPIPSAGVGMMCFVHDNAGAVAICCKCGNPVCGRCQNKMAGRNYCDSCAKLETMAPQAVHQQPPQIIINNQNTNTNANVGVPLVVAAPQVWDRRTAAMLSFFIPGVGQIYKGQIFNGLAHMFMTMLAWATVVLIPVAHLGSAWGASSGDTTRRGG